MRKIIVLLIVFLGVIAGTKVSAQGCSDAGFCTVGNLKPQEENSTVFVKRQKISLVLANGVGDENVYVFTPGIQYDNQLSKRWAIQTKITGNYASGNLGNATGLGDIYLSATYSLAKKNNWATSFILGTKLPLNNGNIKAKNKALPMQYQSSLGTADFIGGFTATNKKWLFAFALQQPLSGTNRNTFLPAYWNNNAALKYTPTNDFTRKGDLLLRTGYNLIQDKKIFINLSMLAIYHLGKDTYIDGNISNQPIVLNGSDGLTLNVATTAQYNMNDKFSIGLSGGIPLVVRDIRPDGLTREFVISPELIFHF